MCRETFRRLPEEKRTRFLDAAWGEFTRVGIEDVSINQIVQKAGVPRGSFYQYFSDKGDLFTYLMERRQTQEQIEDLQQSVSAVNSLKGLYTENEQLKATIQDLEEQLEQLNAEHEDLTQSFVSLEEEKANAEKGLQAMDWFWQIDEAYAKGKYSLCRSLIRSLEEAQLHEYLPKESITNNDRFSPHQRLAEIRGIVY